ncbi:unnamed protein product [Effrenium voratum]|nr:unnamed protein product [Effrenium voratum]
MQVFWRFQQGLQADLRRLSETGHVEAPPELMERILQASKDPEDRRLIMGHLQECTSELSGKHWRRIAGALTLLAALLRRGCPVLMEEIASGYHFDPVQRLSFLEHFQCTEDLRVQKLIQKKAVQLRGEMLQKMSSEGEGETSKPIAENGAARCAKEADHFSSADVIPPVWRKGPVNGIVVVGHNEDTDSESEGSPMKPIRRPASTASTESGGDLLDGEAPVQVEKTEAPVIVDLLDF